MKKITCAMLFAAGLGTSLTASAGTPFVSGDFVDAAGTKGPACVLLSEGVTLNLSKNVNGAFSCDPATNDIRIATCHTSGSNKQTTMDCAVVGFMPDGTTPIWNNGATGAGACTNPPGWNITGYRIYEGSSKGGSVAPADLGTTTCATNAVPAGIAFLP